jgi:hypothetical protein
MSITAGFLLLASFTFAQIPPRETFVLATAQNGGIDNKYPHPNYYASERFVIRYNEDQTHDAYITKANAEAALAVLERSYDTLVHVYKFVPPYHAAANTKYKTEVIVTRGRNNTSGVTEWADGGGTAYGALVGSYASGGANSSERPIQWIPSSLTATTMTHEFGHGLQQMSGGMRDSRMVGWFHESHTQFMTSKMHGGTSGGLSNSRVTMRQAHLHPGYARSRYENWTFLEHIHNVNGNRGWEVINNIWTKSPGRSNDARSNADPFEWIQRGNPDVYPDWASLGDLFGDFAMKSVIYDYGSRKSTFRSSYNATGVGETEKYQRYTYLEALDTNDLTASNNRYVSPHAYAPQRLAFNIIRLYPDAATGTVTVKFRGDVQTVNNRSNYAPQSTSNTELEPPVSNVHNDPGSDWRYGLVAVQGGTAASTSASVTARYSPLMRAVNNGQLTQPDVSMTMQSGDTELYLVVTAAPTKNHKLLWDQYYYTIYRFPYMVEINGAKPEGFQANTAAGRTHSNGGGFIANSVTNVPASVYVGPDAKILGGTVSGNARIEGRAVVRGGNVRGNAVIRDYASVRSGTVEGDAVVSNGAVVWGAAVNQNAKVHGSAILTGGTVTGNAQVGGVTIYGGGTLSGTAQALGDGAGNLAASSGVYFAAGSGSSGDERGSSRTAAPVEFTKERSMTWYGDNNVAIVKAPAVQSAKRFAFDNRGVFHYNLSGTPSANLRIFDSRGRVIKTMTLSGSQTTVNINAASQMLLWKVDVNGKVVGQGKVNIKR